MKIAVILVHYHTPLMLVRAVNALRADIAAGALDAELIVVDNGSREADQELIKHLPVRMLSPGSNLGYAGGANMGAANTKADVLLFMNPDVEVFPGCIKALVRALENGASAVGPRFYWDRSRSLMLPPTEERGRRDEIIRRLATRGESQARSARQRWRHHAHNHWLAERPLISYDLSGALLAVRRNAWEKTGPFDEEFKLYFEETDWLMRLKRKGLKAVYAPEAEAAHFYNQSAAREPSAMQWFAESAARFGRRYYGAWFCAFLDRLKPAKGPVVENLSSLAEGLPEVDLEFSEEFHRPLWIEVSPSPLFFPAAAQVIRDSKRKKWSMPEEVWQYLTPGTYFLQVVDSAGAEIAQFTFTRPAE